MDTALIRPLAWDPPYAASAALKKQKKKKIVFSNLFVASKDPLMTSWGNEWDNNNGYSPVFPTVSLGPLRSHLPPAAEQPLQTNDGVLVTSEGS